MSIARIFIYSLVLAIITGSALLFVKLYSAYESPSDKENLSLLQNDKADLSLSQNIKSFEFFGCAGSYSDGKTQVWRTESKDKTAFLIKHQESCGNTIGSNPRAVIDGTTIDFMYDLSNDTNTVVFCECEYWATFELKSNPEIIKKILVNGYEAQMMNDLSEHNQIE